MKGALLSLAAVLLCVTNLSKAASSDMQSIKRIVVNEAELPFIDLPGYQKADISGPVVPWNKLKTYDQSEIINVVFVSDRKYLEPTHTAIISIFKNSKYIERNEPIRFTIVFDEAEFNGTLDNDMSRFLNAFFLTFDRDIYKYDIEYIPVPKEERECMLRFDTYSWTKNVSLRLFLSRFIQHNKCIYLDGDIACVGDIRKMWNLNLKDKCFGAAGYRSTANVKDHINGGSLLLNLEYMRKVKFGNEIEKILEDGKNVRKSGRFTDEHALDKYSVLYPNRRLMLPYEFNVGVMTIPKQFSGQPTNTLEVTIIHYYGGSKPWKHWSKVSNCVDHSSWRQSDWALNEWGECYQQLLMVEDLSGNTD
ncbi:MAG: hypothetical protein LBP31_00535 [Holosporales bacterium]|jgi:lipopolysaccharide biosynthesis glycosyltransferase|nr:hypothetical protein [Holosporales bacterium]